VVTTTCLDKPGNRHVKTREDVALTTTHRQFAKYAVIGLASNITLYGAYLLLTLASLKPVTAMTLTYVAGLLGTFVLNRYWTFSYSGPKRPALVRYVLMYAVAYVVNYFALSYMVNDLGYRHEIVQAGLILLLAVLIFSAQKLWVFDKRRET